MRLFANQVDAFACGMAAGWLVTYLSLTHERRTVQNVVDLASYHDPTSAQSRMLRSRDLATDEEVWEVYRWVRRIQAGDRNRGFVRREIWRGARMWVIGLPCSGSPLWFALPCSPIPARY
jgi:hypothetical protein